MLQFRAVARFLFACSGLLLLSLAVPGQGRLNTSTEVDTGFGPVMRAYLGYLENEQEVVDDRISRREVSPAYYHRNSNRIRALRQMAIKLVHQSGNDYVPELEAVSVDEFGTLFERAPNPATFRPNEILANKFRFLGVAHTGEVFYVFARLDPYEQAELMQRQNPQSQRLVNDNVNGGLAKGQRVGQTTTRPRRVVPR